MSRMSNRLDKIEKAMVSQGMGYCKTVIRRLSGQEARKAEKEYLLQQAQASLGLCEPCSNIFISRRTRELKREYPNFPFGLPREEAEKIIQECKDAA